jgi:hypothetical protein
LSQKLVREDYRNALLTRLREDHLNLRIVLDVVVALVDIDVAGESRFGGDGRSLRRRLIDEREEEAAEGNCSGPSGLSRVAAN